MHFSVCKILFTCIKLRCLYRCARAIQLYIFSRYSNIFIIKFTKLLYVDRKICLMYAYIDYVFEAYQIHEIQISIYILYSYI